MRQLRLAGTQVDALIANITRRYGLSSAAVNALAVIEGAGHAVPAGEVSAGMHITTATMTTVLDTLERKGYIRRQPDLADRRRVLIDITPDAQALLNRVLPEIQQLATATLSPLGDQALAACSTAWPPPTTPWRASPATSLRLPPAGRHRVSIVPLPPGQRAADLGGPDGAARTGPDPAW